MLDVAYSPQLPDPRYVVGVKRLVLVFGLCFAAHVAHADDMDLALSRLRIPASDPACGKESGLCADEEAYERLVSELAMAAAPQVTAAAHTDGVRGFSVAFNHSVTGIDARNIPWRRGTVGASQVTEDVNVTPASALMWTRVEMRKGLPLGFQIAGDVGHAWDTSLWSVSGRLKLALVEGFHSDLGELPDVSLEVVTQAVVGSSDLSLWTHALHLTLSKPFLLAGRARIAPLVAMQALLVDASSGAVDLAADACKMGSECDVSLSNVVRFPHVRQLRFRWVVGVQMQVSHMTVFATGVVEAPRESVAAAGRIYGGDMHTLQWGLTFGAGVDF